ncbi:LLM class flavin-dependent oxidoreductase [Microbacterium sp. 18062]|uniref:LLM class flavin-dependent oxidoreductase n=1 Tax=Microbacterium sp. 18062 TaxID=2681410 RepID=UPI0013573AED|nr:LLM class flavin-dependent oxidoreductase [Microbacterium sp. 18062]
MTVEFISLTYPNPSNELHPIPGAQIDTDYLIRYARAVEDAGFDYTLQPYGSSSFDPFITGATLAQYTERVKPIIALRPNNIHPTYAAKTLTTLDQVSGGRAVVHFISGGNDAEQAREGDFLTKEQRYARTEEYIRILRRAWQSDEPFDWDGEHYRFTDYSNGVRPVNGTIPISVGGSSAEAYRVGGALGDIFGLWGEPLADTRQQIDAIDAAARAAGRPDRPRVWVTFRPVIVPTEELAWEKAHRVLAALERNVAGGVGVRPRAAERFTQQPENAGSQRLLEVASRGQLHDRALWTEPARVTNAGGASTALVGTPETVAAAILDYVDLGAELVSIRGYDNLNDVIDYGRYLLPLVRQELAHREATGRRGEVVAQEPLAEQQQPVGAAAP